MKEACDHRCIHCAKRMVHASEEERLQVWQVARHVKHRPFLAGRAFEPETIQEMSLALERACGTLRLRLIDDAMTTQWRWLSLKRQTSPAALAVSG